MKASQLSTGQAVKHDGELCLVTELTHVAKGNKRSYYQAKLRTLKTGQYRDVRLRVDEIVEEVFLQKKPMQYSYSAGDGHYFMDMETYEQVPIALDLVGDGIEFLKSGAECEVQICDGQPVRVLLPHTVELQIVETEPVVKGATAQAQLKPARLETGRMVRVPSFVAAGQVIRVDTRSGEYLERVRS